MKGVHSKRGRGFSAVAMPPKKRRCHESDDEGDATRDYARECEELFGCTDLYEIIGLSGMKKDRKKADAAASKRMSSLRFLYFQSIYSQEGLLQDSAQVSPRSMRVGGRGIGEAQVPGAWQSLLGAKRRR